MKLHGNIGLTGPNREFVSQLGQRASLSSQRIYLPEEKKLVYTLCTETTPGGIGAGRGHMGVKGTSGKVSEV